MHGGLQLVEKERLDLVRVETAHSAVKYSKVGIIKLNLGVRV